ncbi:MAG: radical SAM protein [Chloroflexota bacterium]|nr:MAG: radical SAM protein [Chloroflexota bacterium]
MPFLKNIGLLMTFQCQVACPHCIIEAGPLRKEQMPLKDTFDWLEQIASYRDGHIRVVSLTGGEPFINHGRLKAISEFAGQQGLFVSAVTNAYWASTPARAMRTLEDLPALRMIQVSADTYHQKFIPFEWVENAIVASRACQVPLTVAVCTENSADPGYQTIMRQLQEIIEPELIYTAITFRAGRALREGNGHNYEISPEPPMTSCGAGSSPIIFPDGRVIACIGPIIDLTDPHPLVLGNLRQNRLEEILDNAETNPVLHAIRLWGPRKLIAMLQSAGLGHHLPDHYIKDSVCHACYELMSRPAITSFLEGLSRDAEFERMVAYGRIYYLEEPEMVSRLGLHELEA